MSQRRVVPCAVRHRSEVVEYRSGQHVGRLCDRFERLGLAGLDTKNPATTEVEEGQGFQRAGDRTRTGDVQLGKRATKTPMGARRREPRLEMPCLAIQPQPALDRLSLGLSLGTAPGINWARLCAHRIVRCALGFSGICCPSDHRWACCWPC
jgi:hypothetical protein